VVVSSAVVVKDLRRRGAHSDEHVVGVVFAYAQDPPVQVEASPGLGVGALYITLPGRDVVVVVLFLTLDYFLIACFFNESC
jgi:hypothetical protein